MDVAIEFKCKAPFTTELQDASSSNYLDLTDQLASLLSPGLQQIANINSYTFEYNFTFTSTTQRRRRDAEDGTEVQLIVKFSGSIEYKTNLANMENQITDEVTAQVNNDIANSDGTLIDPSETVTVTASAATSTGEVTCNGDEIVEDAVTLCTGSKIGISISICALQQTKFVIDDLYMGDDTGCIGRKRGQSYEFVVDNDKCNIQPSVNGSKLIYSSAVTGIVGHMGPIINRQYRFVSTIE